MSVWKITSLSSIFVVLLAVLFIIKVFNISYPLTVTTKSTSGELAVVGVGKVDVIPDTATVSVGISVNNAQTVSDAQKAISSVNNAVIDSLVKLGVQKSDISTTNYSVDPAYAYDNGLSRVNGYNGNVSLSVKVRKISLVSQVVDIATKNGANQVGNISFTVNNPEKYRELAREKAIQNAKDQAQKLASNLGIHLGSISNIVESNPSQPPVVQPFTQKSTAVGSPNPDIEQGSQTILSEVTLYFDK